MLVDIFATLVGSFWSVIFFTLAERKIIAAIQRREGPNVISLLGVLQPFADALKALSKESVFPSQINLFFFLLGPVFTFWFSLAGLVSIPMGLTTYSFSNNYSLMAFLVFGALGFYGLLMSSWASSSKYSDLAAYRAIAQLVSYEIFLGLLLIPLAALCGSWDFLEIVFEQRGTWNIFVLPGTFVASFICMLAETNRIPFDIPESESEIVAGYNIEYSGFIFALFFLGEYNSMLLNTVALALLFLGGWLPFFFFSNTLFSPVYLSFKIMIFCFLWIFVRATLPRYRYDQMLLLGWSFFLPLSLSFFFMYFFVGIFFDIYPFTLQTPEYSPAMHFMQPGGAYWGALPSEDFLLFWAASWLFEDVFFFFQCLGTPSGNSLGTVFWSGALCLSLMGLIWHQGSPVSVIYLITFFTLVSFFIYFNISEFFGLIILLIYSGALPILFLFVCLNLKGSYSKKNVIVRSFAVLCLFLLFCFFIKLAFFSSNFGLGYSEGIYTLSPIPSDDLQLINNFMLLSASGYFPVLGLLLLVSLLGPVGCIFMLTKGVPKNWKG